MKNLTKHIISEDVAIIDALAKLNKLGNLTLFVINKNEQLVGTLTDGDIRRGLVNGVEINEKINQIMFRGFRYITKTNYTTKQIKEIKALGVQLLPVLDKNKRIIAVIDLKKTKTLLPVDVVIMAGGVGERLKPLTDNVPKPLLNLGSKPIIEHNIDRLISFGVNKFYLTVKYLAPQIIKYFGKGEKKEVNIQYVHETVPLGTIGSISMIDDFSHKHILVMNSDLFTNIDFEEFYQHFIDEGADMSVASIPYNVDLPYAVLDIEDNQIVSFKEKPTFTYYSNAGIYLIKKELLKYIPKETFFNATDFMQILNNKNKRIINFPIVGYWIDIGKHEDYKKAQEMIKYLRN